MASDVVTSSESQLIVPSHLLLDGSTVGGWWPPTNRQSMSISVPVSATSTYLNFETAKQPPNQVNTVSHRDSSSIISFHSLEKRISDCSSSIIRHVYSVLCYSMANSSGSNSSRCSTWWSRERLENEANSSRWASLGKEVTKSSQNRTNQKSPPKSKFFLWKEKAHDQNTQDQHLQNQGSSPLPEFSELSEGEQRIWNEMIDETQVVVTSTVRPDQFYTPIMSLRNRYCCARDGRNTHGTKLCELCLSLPVHRLAGYPKGLAHIRLKWQHLLDKKDVFDHTPLHFAAASQCRKLDLISSLISLTELGANIRAVNTCGDTFLHTLLRYVELDELKDCLPLFRFLAALNFPFCQRDYHGRTPLHIFLDRCQILECQSFEILEEMFDVVKPEIESMDNLGLTISYYFSTRSVNMSAQVQAAELLSKYRTWNNIDINFKSKLDETTGNWQIWNAWVATAGRSTWVDLNGDTALIALIKYWGAEEDELLLVDLVKYLVEIEAQIRSRDRSGDTALAIASTRGFRLVVTVLLDLKASVHSLNYCGATVLNQAQKSLSQARKSGNDRLYATILSCVVLLVDSGARKDCSRKDCYWEDCSRKGCSLIFSLLQSVASGVTYEQMLKLHNEESAKSIYRTLERSGFL
jgi:hypothetical protein